MNLCCHHHPNLNVIFAKELMLSELLCENVHYGIHAHISGFVCSFLYFRQKVYRLETLVQSSSHDFGKLVYIYTYYVKPCSAIYQAISFHVSILYFTVIIVCPH